MKKVLSLALTAAMVLIQMAAVAGLSSSATLAAESELKLRSQSLIDEKSSPANDIDKTIEKIKAGKKLSLKDTLSDDSDGVAKDRFVVFVKDESYDSELQKIKEIGAGVKGDKNVYGQVRAIPIRFMNQSQENIDSKLSEIYDSNNVVAIVPSAKRSLQGFPADAPSDAKFDADNSYGNGEQWYLSEPLPESTKYGIDALRAWQYLDNNSQDWGGNKTALIAVIDSGVAYEDYSKYDGNVWQFSMLPELNYASGEVYGETIVTNENENSVDNQANDDENGPNTGGVPVQYCVDSDADAECDVDLGESVITVGYIDDVHSLNLYDFATYYTPDYTQYYNDDPLQFVVECEDPDDAGSSYYCVQRMMCENPDGNSQDYWGCYSSDMGHANDMDGHGTFVTSIISAGVENGAENATVGIAPNTNILPISIFGQYLCDDTNDCMSDNGYSRPTWLTYDAYTDDVADAVNYAVEIAEDNGQKLILNMSFGGSVANTYEKLVIDTAYEDHDAVIIAASGNSGSETNFYPASYPNVISVGASLKTGTRASYSNYGSSLDLLAPVGPATDGQALVSTSYEAFFFDCGVMNYNPESINCGAILDEEGNALPADPSNFSLFTSDDAAGTSFAAPQVAAVAGLLRSNHSDWSAKTVAHILKRSASIPSSGSNDQIGYGILNAYNAVRGVDDAGNNLLDENPEYPSYLAEGYTAGDFETYLLLMNPETVSAIAQVEYLKDDGSYITREYLVGPKSRYTILVDAILTGNVSMSIKSINSVKIFAERAMYWNNRAGGHATEASNVLSDTWYFAEGYTRDGYDEYLLLGNPTDTDAEVAVSFLKSDGSTLDVTQTVDAKSRSTISVDQFIDGENSIKVEVLTEDHEGIVAERAMYFNNWSGGHDTMGATSLSDKWYFAEGYTDQGFEQWLLLGNPSNTTSTVEVKYLKSNGQVITRNETVNAHSRKTVKVNDILTGENSMEVTVTSGPDIVAERAMYWQGRDDGHVTIGATSLSDKVYFAEGYTAGGFDEYVLVVNPNNFVVDISVDILDSDGNVDTQEFENVAAHSRLTVYVNSYITGSNSVTVRSSGGDIFAERAMYWNNRGGGHLSKGMVDTWDPQ